MSKTPILIGLGYKARHGKDTAAAEMLATFGGKYNIKSYGFADALKEELNSQDQFELCLRYGIEYDHNPDRSDPLCTSKHGKQSRLLQFWGQYRRQQNPFYWVKKLDAKIAADNPTFAVIRDVRYRNEIYYVQSRGGTTVKCTRLGFVDLGRDPNHVSETELDGYVFDFEIQVADGDIDSLKKGAVEVFEHIVKSFEPDLSGLEEDRLTYVTEPILSRAA